MYACPSWPISFDPAHPPSVMLGPAAQTCPGARASRGGATSPPAGGAPHRRSLHSDATRIRRQAARHGEAGRPGWARPGRGWPDTDARATRTTRREREGRRLQRERPPPKPKRVWPTGPPLTTTPHTADVKTSSTGAGVVPGGGEGTRRYAIKAWSRAGRRRPEAARVPALDLVYGSSTCNVLNSD